MATVFSASQGYTKPYRGAYLNKAHLSTVGMMGCWIFNEYSGNLVYDYSRNERNGTRTLDSGSANTTWTRGGLEHNTAGTSSVECGDLIEFNGLTELTVMFRQSIEVSTEYFYFQRWDLSGSLEDQLVLGSFSADTDNLRFFIASAPNDGGSNSGRTSTCPITAGQVHDVTMVFNGTGATDNDRLKCYVDGIEHTLTIVGTIPSALSTVTTRNLLLGTDNAGTPYRGVQHHCYVWNRNLLQPEIMQLHIYPYDMMYRQGYGPTTVGTTVGAQRILLLNNIR